MKKTLLAFSISMVLIFFLMTTEARGQYSSFIPTWKVGDQWKVETNPIGFTMAKKAGGAVRTRIKKKAYVHFKVIGKKTISKTRCFVLKVTNTLLPSHYNLMYVRIKDFTLKRFVAIQKIGGKEVKKVTNNPSKPFLLQQMGILCPFDFPQFPNMNKDKVIKTTLGLSNKKLIETISFNKKKTKVRIEIRVKVNGKMLKSIQYWTQGYPWWSKAERRWGKGKKGKWEVGKLVSYKLVKRRGR